LVSDYLLLLSFLLRTFACLLAWCVPLSQMVVCRTSTERLPESVSGYGFGELVTIGGSFLWMDVDSTLTVHLLNTSQASGHPTVQ
jgi:hypothetical protein